MPPAILFLLGETSRAVWHVVWTVNLAALTLDHLVTGFIGIISPRKAIAIYSRIFGVQMPSSPELLLVLRPWGALGVFAGLATIFPIFDPVRYKGILLALLILLLLRLVIRVSMSGKANQFFQLSSARNYFHLFLIFLCSLLIASELWML